MPTLPRTGFFAQFTEAQLRAQYRRNADGLRGLLRRAEATGKKANGFTADQLRERIAVFEQLGTDPEFHDELLGQGRR